MDGQGRPVRSRTDFITEQACHFGNDPGLLGSLGFYPVVWQGHAISEHGRGGSLCEAISLG